MILCKHISFFLVSLVFFITSHLFGQDAHYSQFYANPLSLNPAFAGANNCPRFSLNFRDQWPAIPNNFLCFSGSYDQHIHAIRSGIGVIVSADMQGYQAGNSLINTYNAGAIYNFRAKITHNFNLHFALQGGFLTSSVNWENTKYASEFLGYFPPAYEALYDYKTKTQFDAAFGFVGYTPFLYFGLALHHLFPIQKSFFNRSLDDKYKTKWEPKYTAHIGGKITIKQKMRAEINMGDIFLYPNLIFISQGTFHYLHEGFYFNFYPFTIGTWVRHNFKNFDAFVISCGIEYKFLRIGYSYDFSLTKLEGTGGAHEVSLQITIPCSNENGDRMSAKKKKRQMQSKYAPLNCPKF